MEQENKTDKLLEVRDLQVSFFTPAGEVKAVNGISYDVNYDEVMGIVGESGSGKSVEAYSIIGLLQNPGKVVGGSITFEGQDMLSKTKDEMIAFRGKEVAMRFSRNIINFCSVKKRTDMNVQSRDYKKRQQNKRHMRINMQNVTGRLRNLKQRFCR